NSADELRFANHTMATARVSEAHFVPLVQNLSRVGHLAFGWTVPATRYRHQPRHLQTPIPALPAFSAFSISPRKLLSVWQARFPAGLADKPQLPGLPLEPFH